jgi:hypothetical protein
MKGIEKLVKDLINGKNVTLRYKRYNDGTKDCPDVLIDRVWAFVEEVFGSNSYKEFVFCASKENDSLVFDTEEIYRIPWIEDLDILIPILKEARKQAPIYDRV